MTKSLNCGRVPESLIKS